MNPTAPDKFVQWLSLNEHTDKSGRRYRYHPRSDSHSKALCRFILIDLLDSCPMLEEHAVRGRIAFGINYGHRWEATRKPKTIDLAIGKAAGDRTEARQIDAAELKLGLPAIQLPSTVTAPRARIVEAPLESVLISCEAKAVMTEHSKSQPRLFDELSSSHEIVHRGRVDAIAAGITVVNIAPTFVSPLRQKDRGPLIVTKHNSAARDRENDSTLARIADPGFNPIGGIRRLRDSCGELRQCRASYARNGVPRAKA